MSTLDRSNRSWGSISHLPESLWKRFEEINLVNVKELIRSMEISISYGWMGVAAEISEYLQLTASKFLDEDPALRLQVEIERLKRFSYMGFEQATRLASNRVLEFVEALKDRTPPEERLVSESIAVSSVGWFLKEPSKLEGIIERCKDIDGRFENTTSKNRYLCASFIHALEGRLYALRHNFKECRSSFQKSKKVCKEHGFELPLSHITMHYAESLRLLDDWEGAIDLAKNFLNECCKDSKNPFRSHLMLRAILFLLEAPKEFVSPQEFEFNTYRYRMLVYAMGLEESGTLYPLLEKAERLISDKSSIAKTDLYQLFMPGPVIDRLSAFDGDSLERLVMLYYESKGYTVINLAHALPAVDLVASHPDSPQHFMAIQVKSGTRGTTPEELPHFGKFDDAKRYLSEHHSISSVSLYRWHSAAKLHWKAIEALHSLVTRCIDEKCEVDVKLNEELVEDLIARREIGLLIRIFSNEFTIDERRRASKELRDGN